MAKHEDVMQSLTHFERARVIGARSLQLAMGAPPLVKADDVVNAVKLAFIEFEKNVIPLRVIRASGITN